MNIGLIFKLISPFHDSEAAWQDAKRAGLNPLMQAKVIALILALGAIVAKDIFNVIIPPEQVTATANALVNVIQGIVVIYSAVMYASDAYFKAHPKVVPMAPVGQAPVGVQVGAPETTPEKNARN